MAIKYGTFQYGTARYGGERLVVSPNQITCNNYIYSDGDILSGSCHIEKSLAGDELSIDTLDAMLNVDSAVFTTKNMQEFQTSDGDTFMCANPMSRYAYGNEVKYEHDGSLIGKFYFEKAQRKGQTKYEFSCTSVIGLLDNVMHNGGIYTKVSAGTIIAEIMGNVPYTINSNVASVSVSGWLPVATCRDNLQQVLFAIGAGVFKDLSGKPVIGFFENSAPLTIGTDRIYVDGSINYQTPYTKVDVNEHAFYALSDDKSTTLFSTSTVVNSQKVVFNSPCHDLSASGLTIEKSGVNYAIVSGTGTLTGKEYTHTKKIITYGNGVSGSEKTASVTDATLVSSLNSYDVAVRISQYGSLTSTDSISFVVEDERPASEVTFTGPFGDAVSGFIKSMDITMSATLKADAEIAIGFLPSNHGGGFENYVLLTNSGSWTVPNGVTKIYVILVGGGDGGNGGAGGDLTAGYPYNSKAGGDGGKAGNGGQIFETNLAVTSESAFQYSCGTGGLGGTGGVGSTSESSPATSGNSGVTGTPTTFGGLSSASGARVNGYQEPKSGLTFGTFGTNGITGGNSSYYDNGYYPGNNITFNGVTYTAGKSIHYNNYVTVGGERTWIEGGDGGGAAVGSNGEDGSDYIFSYPDAISGDGGSGATASIAGANATSYGGGGSGGHGGGRGGNSGGKEPYGGNFEKNGYTSENGKRGNGGSGSPGGKGGDGCIVIYY